eukprot:COSAG01_NODE_235_length_20918_cov_41.045086_12_plen_100_part_00
MSPPAVMFTSYSVGLSVDQSFGDGIVIEVFSPTLPFPLTTEAPSSVTSNSTLPVPAAAPAVVTVKSTAVSEAWPTVTDSMYVAGTASSHTVCQMPEEGV